MNNALIISIDNHGLDGNYNFTLNLDKFIGAYENKLTYASYNGIFRLVTKTDLRQTFRFIIEYAFCCSVTLDGIDIWMMSEHPDTVDFWDECRRKYE